MSFHTNALDSIVGVFFDSGTTHLLAKIARKRDDNHMRERIEKVAQQYFESNFEMSSYDQEFDFAGINCFINEHLLDRVMPCFNCDTVKNREYARRDLMEQAYHYANATEISEKKQVFHYVDLMLHVIESCLLDRIDEKDMFLANKTVDEVNMLLQKYLQQIKENMICTIDHKKTFAEFIDNTIPPQDNLQIFHYRNEILQFQAREKEIKIIDSFLETEEAIRWMAVVGQGGTGKSKLLYHYIKSRKYLQNWKMVWLQSAQLDVAMQFTDWRYSLNLLIVIDYAGAVSDKLGACLQKLDVTSARPPKIRFVILERQGLIENNYNEKIDPFWYKSLKGDISRKQCIEHLLYKVNIEQPFLQLSGLSKENIYNIIEAYASQKAVELDASQKSFIFEKAREIDNNIELPRPLLILFVADAIISRDEYTKWDIPLLVENIIERHKMFWKQRVCGNDEGLFIALQKILVYATATGEWDLNKLDTPFGDASQKLLEQDYQKLTQMLCAVNTQTRFEEKLPALEPDLIGEFFVLLYFKEVMYDTQSFQNMIYTLWKKPSEFAFFLLRCIDNYGEENAQQDIIVKQINILFNIQLTEQNEETAKLLSFLFWRISLIDTLVQKTNVKRKMIEIIGTHPKTIEMIELCAKGLVNLTTKEKVGERKETIQVLCELSLQYPQNMELQVEYANGLVNLTDRQDVCEIKETIQLLRELAIRYPHNFEIKIDYAKCFVNLTARQEVCESKKAIQALRKLALQYPGSLEMQIIYAKGLFNLSAQQELCESKETLQALRDLALQYPRSFEMQVEYAKGLVNLSDNQKVYEIEETVQALRELALQYPLSLQVQEKYAKGLLNLSLEQKVCKSKEIVQALHELALQYPQSFEVQEEYGKSLVNLAIKQKVCESKETVQALHKLALQYSSNLEVQRIYAKGLLALVGKQEVCESTKSVQALRELYLQYPQSPKIQEEYAKGLFELVDKQKVHEAKETLQELRELALQCSQSPTMQKIYKIGLTLLLSNKLGPNANETTI